MIYWIQKRVRLVSLKWGNKQRLAVNTIRHDTYFNVPGKIKRDQKKNMYARINDRIKTLLLGIITLSFYVCEFN